MASDPLEMRRNKILLDVVFSSIRSQVFILYTDKYDTTNLVMENEITKRLKILV